jgi:membrane associated rhomboid family serine protease
MAGIREEIEKIFKEGDPLNKLIAVNLFVFVFILILQILSTFTQTAIADTILPYFTLPSSLGRLILKPWTLFTYMFVHEGFMHILFNLLYLYFAGQLFQLYLGRDKLWSTFILGGFAGGLLYIISYNIFPFFEEAIAVATNRGASAGVMAILIAAAVMAPNYPVRLFFVLNIKLWQVALILVLVDLAYMPMENPGGHIAHIGGALYGYVMARQWRDKHLYLGEFLDRWMEAISDAIQPKAKMKVAYKRSNSSRSSSSFSNEKSGKSRSTHDQDKLNAILDKISKGGYESLNKEEKDFLFRMSDK